MNHNPCKKYEAWLTTKVFGELSAAEAEKLQEHLAACVPCRNFLVEMENVLRRLGAPRRPQLPEHFWEGYWHRLAQRLEKDERRAPAREPAFGRSMNWLREKWMAQPMLIPLGRTAGILALLVLGVLVGHYWWPQDRNENQPIVQSSAPAMPVVQTRAEQWLERSEILLLGMVNEDLSGEFRPDFSHQRRVSRHLLTEARALNRELDPVANRQMLQLINQLELILLQIANLEAEHDLSAIELVREGVARNGLLLKINIIELAQQAQQQNLAPIKPQRKSL
ncbi:MAG: zf-HC2 domain-containing protein [candidate division KSB1 bacterium]|nr:zf-HC2 domain-containing protein [candidate division KSB1 bacterium]MDZ7368239.1 zf-HC2 domain-containing protein [candidate division KSB1 bacterium]MDZ7406779.1 zf-HC2 domain-containing protein [candidate division KSB1 bacterium]